MSAFILVHEPASLLLVVAQAVLEKVQLALTGTDKKKKKRTLHSRAFICGTQIWRAQKKGMPVRRGLSF